MRKVIFFTLLSVTVWGQDLENFFFPDYVKSGNHNPIIPGFFADPSLVVINDTFFIYATTVSRYMEPVVWYSTDMQNWDVRHLGITGEHLFWAPTMIKGKDDKYYLYYSSGFDFKAHLQIGNSPFGPWEDIGVVEEGFDMQIFEDPRDGKVYGISSDPSSRPRLVEFNSDPSSPGYLSEVIQEGAPSGSFFDYREGSALLYRKGLYYLMYSGGGCGNDNYKVRYSTSENIWGPYREGNTNPVLEKDPEKGIFGTGHHSVMQYGKQYFIAYHRADLYNRPSCDERQVCIDLLEFDQEGNILPISPTNTGVDFSSLLDVPEKSNLVNLAVGKEATAPGNKVSFDPQYAVDQNYATRWEGSKWLTVDLKKVMEIHQIVPRFLYYDYFNLFRIKYSDDNVNWKLYLDRAQEAKKAASPLNHQKIAARYVKIEFVRGPKSAGLFELEILGPPQE